ncbi:hypothetical protein, partial [Salmonella sp. s54836]|uniref:hypothetical protein n=1 Tax=Salmonella sp. s54836 TaxID=3159673 RepID=UPI003980B16C
RLLQSNPNHFYAFRFIVCIIVGNKYQNEKEAHLLFKALVDKGVIAENDVNQLLVVFGQEGLGKNIFEFYANYHPIVVKYITPNIEEPILTES